VVVLGVNVNGGFLELLFTAGGLGGSGDDGGDVDLGRWVKNF